MLCIFSKILIEGCQGTTCVISSRKEHFYLSDCQYGFRHEKYQRCLVWCQQRKKSMSFKRDANYIAILRLEKSIWLCGHENSAQQIRKIIKIAIVKKV